MEIIITWTIPQQLTIAVTSHALGAWNYTELFVLQLVYANDKETIKAPHYVSFVLRIQR